MFDSLPFFGSKGNGNKKNRKQKRDGSLRRRGMRLESLEERQLLAVLSFAPAQSLTIPSLTTGTADVLVANFNAADSYLDIVTSYNDGNYPTNSAKIAVFKANGPASFDSAAILTDANRPWTSTNGSLQVGDFNNDSKFDFSITMGGSNSYGFGDQVSSWVGDGSGGFTRAQDFSTGGSLAKHIVGNFTSNADSNQDLLIPTYDSHDSYLHTGAGSGIFSGGVAKISGRNLYGLVALDFNADGA